MQTPFDLLQNRTVEDTLKAIDPKEALKKIKKELFDRAQKEYTGAKPFGMYWGMNTAHLKTLSDWTYAKRDADDIYTAQLRENKKASWFKIFFGILRPQKFTK